MSRKQNLSWVRSVAAEPDTAMAACLGSGIYNGNGLECCHPVYRAGQASGDIIGYYAIVDFNEPNIENNIVVPNNKGMHPCLTTADYPNKYNNTPKWKETPDYSNIRLIINANFFSLQKKPYEEKCTKALGYSYSGSQEVSGYSQVHDCDTQTLAFLKGNAATANGPAKIVDKSAFEGFDKSNVVAAVSGFKLITNKQYNDLSCGIKATHKVPRTAAGLIYKNNKATKLVIMVVNPGNRNDGLTTQALATKLIDLGVTEALNLDGGGSAQFFFKNGGTECKTLPSDERSTNLDGTCIEIPTEPKKYKCYRPYPIFLGIR